MSNQTSGTRKARSSSVDIVQVARRAGVSPATVSRVANGRSTVAEHLAKRVWKAIRELGYTPNPQARALVSGRSRVLGLLVSEITNPFFPELMQSFEDVAGEHDFEVLIGSTNYNRERAKVFVRRLVQRRAEGIAVMTFRAESELLDELIAEGIPLVTIDVGSNAPRSTILEVDYALGIDQAVQHLARLGHRLIGFASGPMPHLTNERRKDAFVHSVKKIGLRPESAPIFVGDHTFEGGTQAALHFLGLGSRPTAIVCSNDMMAVGVLRVMTESGISVPRDMSVIGFDDIHLAEFMNPPLTTVRMSRQELARAAYKGLEQLWNGSPANARNPIRVATELVIRQSTDEPRKSVGEIRSRTRRAELPVATA